MRVKQYRVRLIKDKGPYSTGEMYGPVDIVGYKSLYEAGYINDYLGLIETKKAETKKTETKKTETKKEETKKEETKEK